MSFGKMLIHKCEIFRHTKVTKGNFTKDILDSIYPAGTRCRFVRKNATNTDANGRTKISAYYVVILPKRIRVKNKDIIIWSDNPTSEYQVQEPYSPDNRYNKFVVMKEGEA